MLAASNTLSQPRMGMSLYTFPLILFLGDKDQGGAGRGGNCLRLQLAKEVLVPTPADDMHDLSSTLMQDGTLVAMPA